LKPLARAASITASVSSSLWTAIYGLLDGRVEVLDADAHAVEAQFSEQFDGCAIDLARVDFDRVLAVFDQLEVLACCRHQLAHFIVREEGRRTATPVQLRHFLIATFEIAALQRQFARQILQILG
jgi:hypothetical protein